MGLFKKASDPISARSRQLNQQIQRLESEIKHLNQKIHEPPHPRVRSTARPHDPAPVRPAHAKHLAASRGPIFETLEPARSSVVEEEGPQHYNDLGVRKYDLLAAWRRLRNHLKGPAAANPKLVSYLAAGSINGLRPLRYEKRVARNRFIATTVFVVMVLWAMFAVLNH